MAAPDPATTGLLLVGLVFLGLYSWVVYNDLTRRRERLRGLMATVHSMQLRRHGVAQAGSRGVRWATRHEQQVARLGARRGGRGGRLVGDIANQWPSAGAVGSANQAMNFAVQSHDAEAQAWQQLQREAEAYNAALRQFPRCLVAPALGFRPWRFGSDNRRRRWTPWRRTRR
jgi:hypothetical protein